MLNHSSISSEAFFHKNKDIDDDQKQAIDVDETITTVVNHVPVEKELDESQYYT